MCPSAEERAATREQILEQVLSRLSQPLCPCGGPGQWTRIAHLNMSDPSQQCPSNWSFIAAPVRGCGRSASPGPGCDSVTFASTGQSYSHVCGRVSAYQSGEPNAFSLFSAEIALGLEGVYVDGVSLTHGAEGARQHIWTFVAALSEIGNELRGPVHRCPCTDINWPFEVPEFVGDDYFCDTGNHGPKFASNTVYTDDPLWDGEGCGPTSTCCEFNNPPWFCTTLPQPTTDDIEARICFNDAIQNEDVLLALVDIYIM